MTSERKVKEISIETLENAQSKVARGKLRKAAIAAVFLLAAVGGGYGAYRIISGDVVTSRFAVNKMTCPACVITMKEVTEKLPGVVKTDVSLSGQDVSVQYREKTINPEQLIDAIVRAGYPAKLDGTYTGQAEGLTEPVAVLVNGKPLFRKDFKIPLAGDRGNEATDTAMSFFNVVGAEILIQAADAKMVVVQPQEIEEESEAARNSRNISPEQFLAEMGSKYGSKEKYQQTVARRLALHRLVEEHVVAGVQNPDDRNKKITEWLGESFRAADVKIMDTALKDSLRSAVGQDEWKTFWPRLIGSPSELRTAIAQQ
jgi:copper chaperone CopZ